MTRQEAAEYLLARHEGRIAGESRPWGSGIQAARATLGLLPHPILDDEAIDVAREVQEVARQQAMMLGLCDTLPAGLRAKVLL